MNKSLKSRLKMFVHNLGLVLMSKSSVKLGKKKICVFPVTQPTLIYPSDPKVFIGIIGFPTLALSLSYLKLYCCLNTCFD